MSVFADFSQVSKLAKDLGNLGKGTLIVSEQILDEVGEQVRAEASAAAPVLTGALQRSVWLRKNKMSRRVGSSLRQGVFQEFGTSRHGPQPWLFPAGDKGGDTIYEKVGEAAVKL